MSTDTHYPAAFFLVLLTATAPGQAAGQDAAEADRLLPRPQWPSHAQHMAGPAAEVTFPREVAPPAARPAAVLKAHAVQAGAFRTLTLAQKAVSDSGLDNATIMIARRGDQNWYVLVLGSYEQRVDAQAAAHAYLEAHPGGSAWVRSGSDLKPLGVIAGATR